MKLRPAAALAVAALAVPAAAQAHVTIQPPTAVAGSYTVESVRVPNEQSDASTTKVDVQLPDGFLSVSYQAVPGWTAKITNEKLSTPIKVEGVDVTEQVKQVTFTATGKGIEPGQFQDFPLSLLIPKGAPGSKLTFKAVQTYSNGDVTRWIGEPGSDEPAPQVTLTADNQTAPTASTQPATTTVEKEADNGLAIAALILGALALMLGVAVFFVARKKTGATT